MDTEDRGGRRPGNPLIRELIIESGSSHAGLAKRVNDLGARQGLTLRYDKSSVSRWIEGKQPRGTAGLLIAEALATKLGRAVTPFDCGFSAPEVAPAATRTLTYPDDVSEAVHSIVDLATMDASRRSVMGAVPFTVAALVEPQRSWLLGLLETRATHLTLAADGGPAHAVRSMTAVFDEMDNRFGGGHCRISVIRYLSSEVTPLLQQHGLPSGERAELFTAAAKLAAMSGWMSYDTGEYGLAQRYMTQGLRLCAEGRDRVLGGQILAGLSHLATSLGQPKEGIMLARAGIVTAKSAGSPLGLMRLHAMVARGQAAQGDSRGAIASLAGAEAALATSRGPQSEAVWVRYLDEAYLHAESAQCFRDLRQPVPAQRAARDSVTANADRGRRQAISQAVLASAHLQQGDLDVAVDTAITGLGMLERVRSQRSRQAFRDFRRELLPHRREPLAQRFDAAATSILGAIQS